MEGMMKCLREFTAKTGISDSKVDTWVQQYDDYVDGKIPFVAGVPRQKYCGIDWGTTNEPETFSEDWLREYIGFWDSWDKDRYFRDHYQTRWQKTWGYVIAKPWIDDEEYYDESGIKFQS